MKKNNERATVISVKDYLVYLEGVPSVGINDVLVDEKGARALVMSLEDKEVEAVMLDESRPLPGDIFKTSETGINVNPSDKLLGRVFNPLGEVLDNKAPLEVSLDPMDLEVVASGIRSRKMITQQLITGFSTIDILIPIGIGQRELIVGEPRSGKATFILDTIINQKGTDTICIYGALGKPVSEIKRISELLRKRNALEYSIIVATSSADPSPLIAICPQVAFAIADYFRKQGKKVLLVLDDLGIHGKHIREMALLSGKTPGRESYPGDIFYQHAHLMERAGNFNEKAGSGSVTLLPVIQTNLDSLTDLIPTNLMSSTDGHLFFSSSLRSQGYYPSIDIPASVTRVGHQTQNVLFKQIAHKLKQLLADYRNLERFSRFSSELNIVSQQTLKRGVIAQELLRQNVHEKLEILDQLSLLSLVFVAFFDNRDLSQVKAEKPTIIKEIQSFNKLKQSQTLTDYPQLEQYFEYIKNQLVPKLNNGKNS